MRYILLLVAFVPLITGMALPEDMVLVSDNPPTSTLTSADKTDYKAPKITSFNVHSNITNRFAKTVVTSKVKNEAPVAQETTFFIIIPDQAFISGFIMDIGGKNYTAYVQEKEKARATYDEAVLHGTGAAHIALSARDSNKFEVSTNIEPQSKAIFYLTYEELLERKEGTYEQIVNIHPNQVVADMTVDVDIIESRPITKVTTPSIRSGNEIAKESPDLDPKADIEKISKTHTHVRFSPNSEQQKKIARGLSKEEEKGINGQFVVQYEVSRDPHGGEVLVKDGYFVHFFAPSELEPLVKHVVFVLDTSGSMYGKKMEQLKIAMNNILDNLNEKDYYNLVEFNTNVKVWNLDAPQESAYFPENEDSWYHGDTTFNLTDVSFPPAYPVKPKTIEKAKSAVDKMIPTGGTNIYEALRVGLHLVKQRRERTKDNTIQPMMIFLTDGDPTVGKTSSKDIISGITEQNLNGVPIISLSFGTGADRDLLEKISLGNSGFARHIYEDSDASLQLENFYKEISSPLLSKVKFVYTPDVTSISRVEHPILYGGGEIVVCGTYSGNEFNKEGNKVVSYGPHGPIQLLPTIEKPTGQLERLWAYLTVKKYLDAKKVAQGDTKEYDKKALDLALKYSFVTPVTSLVVVKPNASQAVDAQAADSTDNPYPIYGFGAAGGAYPHRVFASPALIAGGPPPPLASRGMIANPVYMLGMRGPVPQASFSSGIAPINSMDYDAQPEAEVAFDAYYPTTTIHFEPTLSPTPSTTTVTEEPVTLPPSLAEKITWLSEEIRPDGTLKFLKGTYQLGFNATSPTDEECTDPSSKDGQCVLLKDCEGIYSILTSPKIFKEYFCAIKETYAGVCCPKK